MKTQPTKPGDRKAENKSAYAKAKWRKWFKKEMDKLFDQYAEQAEAEARKEAAGERRE
jgi:hypothetical protein